VAAWPNRDCRQACRKLTIHHEYSDGIRAALAAHDLLRKRMSEQRFHALRRRHWWYQNLAQWLCRRYAAIALEADMALPSLYARSDNSGLLAAAVYRNYAAVGHLRTCLIAASGKTGTRIDGKTAYSTSTCWRCGAGIITNANLVVRCPNGHEFDQDKLAALNLFSQMDDSFGQPHELQKFKHQARWR
jgi:transposase